MIERTLAPRLRELSGHYPVVVLTGPRQSGKTTLCRSEFAEKPYVSLEPLDARAFARSDPRGFLADHRGGAIIDEVQHAPDLLSYLQAEVDEDPTPGRFVLTGSQHLGLSDAVSQSLAGRAGILHLLPPDLAELRRFGDLPEDLTRVLWTGAYPRIHDRGIPADRWLADYLSTYVQRDVRSVTNVTDLGAFTTFLELCAGNTAQELNLSRLGGDAGVTHNTARSWLSVLETSFLVFRLPAWHRNLKKRLVKRPKLHFLDSGLACRLLGIAEPAHLRRHPLRGAIFESWVAAEVFKARIHRGASTPLHHYRDAKGLEVDLVLERGDELALVEAKSGATVAPDSFAALDRLGGLIENTDEWRTVRKYLAHGGDAQRVQSGVTLIPWSALDRHSWLDT